MYKLLLAIVALFLTTASWAGDHYVYLENPNPAILSVNWGDSPSPNCHEIGPNGFETYGWIIHEGGARVRVWLSLKDNPEASFRKYVSDWSSAGNTVWRTLPGYTPYRTWACG